MVPSPRYVRLTELAQRAFGHGRLGRALHLFEVAEEEARNSGDRELADRAFCNRCVVLAELDRLSLVSGELKHILMRSRDPFTAMMAAYYTSQAYMSEENIPRALAYARRASDLADACGQSRAVAVATNWHGALALKESNFQEAADCFHKAIELDGERAEDPMGNAITKDNLGYCWMCTGRPADGIRLCSEAAAVLENEGARQYLAEVYQDLCYGALQEGRFQDARAWGEKALALAREFEHPGVERNTLMLLADAAMDEGDESVADDYLGRLAAHYPDFQGMKTFFQAFNVREVINLKA
jgi:tetratricopeptide (TPR) repeat protein